MRFFSDNAAPVHPKVWEAMRGADSLDTAYDGDRWSARLDAAFSAVFGRECRAMAVTTGTAANALACAAMAEGHQGILCHEEAHIEMDEAGAPGFYAGGAKLMLLPGAGAKIAPETIAARLDAIRPDVHQVQAAGISITNATEYGLVYSADEVAGIAALAKAGGLKLHMDGARFANAAARLDGDARAVTEGVDLLSFGCVKNGGMSAEALVFFDTDLYAATDYRRKRAGHLLSKGRYLAAQILAMLEDDLWLENARTANAAAAMLGAAAGGRLLYPVEANEIFLKLSAEEAAGLRNRGFDFYDWGPFSEEGGAARLVTSWQHEAADVQPLADAIAAL
ncbi:threonine aldolase family protein [Novosphingopyxis sp.]|uniref:threonine aldolase family protein n=1 Tax=Novosphingopyxis sp. TaxID=2709690 RepID=UPI003B58F244